jgi:hypothetical protein
MEDGLSQAFFATICDTVKGIGAGFGPLPWPVYRLFGLVGVGPYRSLEHVHNTRSGGQVKRLVQKSA